MKLSKTEVEKIARLARLKLSDGEIEEYRGQLSDVLGHIAQLDEVDVADVPITTQVTGQTNVLAEDAVRPSMDPKRSLAGAPATEGSQIKVKAVFEEA